MVTIKVLGPSCGKCVRLESMVIAILEELGSTDAVVEKVAEPQVIERYLIDDPPGLLINEQLYWAGGELPGRDQLKGWLTSEVVQQT